MNITPTGPIEVAINTRDYAGSTTQRFNEFISERLRAAGVPLANSFHIRPSTGRLVRLPDDLHNPEVMHFIWHAE